MFKYRAAYSAVVNRNLLMSSKRSIESKKWLFANNEYFKQKQTNKKQKQNKAKNKNLETSGDKWILYTETLKTIRLYLSIYSFIYLSNYLFNFWFLYNMGMFMFLSLTFPRFQVLFNRHSKSQNELSPSIKIKSKKDTRKNNNKQM